MINNMDSVKNNGQMVLIMKETMKTVRKMVKEYFDGKKGLLMKANLRKI